MASQTITALGNAIINLVDRKTPIATANTVGMVKPDGSTINIDANGVISSNGGGGSGLEVCDIGMALYVDETKGLRRYLNGQIVDINTNTQAFLNRLKQITTLHPSLLCTEEEWQSAKTLSAFGQVGKFVFNYSGDKIVSVRLPRVVNVQGLFDLQNLGMTVGAGLPNITGETHYEDVGIWMSNVNNVYKGAFVKKGQLNRYLTGTSGAGDVLGFDASKSNPIYGNSDTVQQEAIQYPYFIQVATGSETENNIINEIELNNPYSLFDSKYSDHELNNLSWLKSNGQWNSGTVYVDAYDELLTEYNNSSSTTKTEGSITYKLTPKGYKIALADQETAIDTKYSKDGIAWYYILDTTNEKFKLPKAKHPSLVTSTSTVPVVGNGMALGLTDGTNNFSLGVVSDVGLVPRAPYGGSVGSAVSFTEHRNATLTGVTTDPANSGLVADLSSNVKDYNMYLYFYVGETVQNANLIDAGRIGEQLTNKVDINFNNMNPSQTAKNTIVGWGMPDYSATIIPTSPFVAPCNGYLFALFGSGKSLTMTITQPDGKSYTFETFGTYSNDMSNVCYPISKDCTVVSNFPNTKYFYPCIGG